MIEITEEQHKIVLDILNRYLPNDEVRAFGSRYKGNVKKYSDLDLVIVGTCKIEIKLLFKIKETFEESTLPFRVDVLDWHRISSEFQQIIEQGFEVIKRSEET